MADTTSKVTINPEFRTLIPPLSSDEYSQLEANILADGCRDPLVHWNGILVDGHNRYEICSKHGLPYKLKAKDFESKDHAKLWMRFNQLGRRNLTDDQRTMIADAAAELESKLVIKERGEASGRGHKKSSDTPSDNFQKPKIDTRSKVAKQAKVSERKMKQARAVRKKRPDLAKKVQDGELPLAAAFRETKKDEIKERLESIAAREPEAPTGKFDVLVIDPPWPMEKMERDCRPNQTAFDYPTMKESELLDWDMPSKFCASDCHVFLWTTHRFLPLALECLSAWGFKYCCTFVWHKKGGFQPVGLPQFNCEFALYARKGSPQFVDTKAFPVCFDAKRGDHSEKPEEFYETLRRVTAGRRLDMFNRRKIEGFIGWGKEAE